MSEQFLIVTLEHEGRTVIHLPIEMVEDGAYRDLETDLRRAGLLMNAAHGSNQHIVSVLAAPQARWSEALRRWLADPSPESLTKSVAPKS